MCGPQHHVWGFGTSLGMVWDCRVSWLMSLCHAGHVVYMGACGVGLGHGCMSWSCRVVTPLIVVGFRGEGVLAPSRLWPPGIPSGPSLSNDSLAPYGPMVMGSGVPAWGPMVMGCSVCVTHLWKPPYGAHKDPYGPVYHFMSLLYELYMVFTLFYMILDGFIHDVWDVWHMLKTNFTNIWSLS